MTTAPNLVIDPERTAIAMAYRNGAYIAPLVLPNINVSLKQYKFTIYPADEPFNIPDTQVGRYGNVPQLQLKGSDGNGACVDNGLDIPVVQEDIDQAAAAKLPNPLDRAILKSTDYVDLSHEQRAANIVFALGSYPAANRVTLAGDDQFSSATSDPVKRIMTALDVPLLRPNTIVFSQSSWTGTRMNPKVVAATNKNSGDSGAAARQAVAELFEVQNIVVGQSRYNTAKPGQAAAIAPLWGKHIALLYIDPNADATGGVTFGWTANYGNTVAYNRFDATIGARGAQVARCVKSQDERIVASACGYFIQNAVA